MKTNCSWLPGIAKQRCDVRSKSPFTAYHNGIDRCTIINEHVADISEYFNVWFEAGMIRVEYKKFPSYEEYEAIKNKLNTPIAPTDPLLPQNHDSLCDT